MSQSVHGGGLSAVSSAMPGSRGAFPSVIFFAGIGALYLLAFVLPAILF